MSEELKTKAVSTTQITVPLISICAVFFALMVFTAQTFYEKERAQFQIEVVIPITDQIDFIIRRLDEFEKESTKGRFGRKHYEIMVKYIESTNGQFPPYDWIHEQVLRTQ